jgi:hypothetical protein
VPSSVTLNGFGAGTGGGPCASEVAFASAIVGVEASIAMKSRRSTATSYRSGG